MGRLSIRCGASNSGNRILHRLIIGWNPEEIFARLADVSGISNSITGEVPGRSVPALVSSWAIQLAGTFLWASKTLKSLESVHYWKIFSSTKRPFLFSCTLIYTASSDRDKNRIKHLRIPWRFCSVSYGHSLSLSWELYLKYVKMLMDHNSMKQTKHWESNSLNLYLARDGN